MNRKKQDQHYVSQVLLKRFKPPGKPLQCYQIKTGEWKERGLHRAFSARGWNQLLLGGQADNSLEVEFSKVESLLPETFQGLEAAASTSLTTLSPEIYHNMCLYCTFLSLTSPFAKARAVANLLLEMNSELEQGKDELLRELGFYQDTIDRFRKGVADGGRLIMHSRNYLQLVYRIQFRRLYPAEWMTFRHWAKWAICHSPIELPISDMALVPLHSKDQKIINYLLPIAPHLLLKGQTCEGPQTATTELTIKGGTLTTEEADYWRQVICLSAVTELAFLHRIPDVAGIRARAATNGISFVKIVEPELLISAGTTDFDDNFGFCLVPVAEYVKFIHRFIQPQGLRPVAS